MPNDGGTGDGLISPTELRRLSENGNVAIVDATYFSPTEDGNVRTEYERCRIPNARFFDIDRIARCDPSLPHMLTDASTFERDVGKLGIGSDQHVVVYDRHFLRSAPRVWWTFRRFGHENVSVLDGGLSGWQEQGFPVESGRPTLQPSIYECRPNDDLYCTLDRAIDDASSGRRLYLDARPARRFDGSLGDNWTERRGHMRGSKNVPAETLRNDLGRLKSKAEIQTIFQDLLDGRDVVAMCGSGISAAIVALALFRIGLRDVPIFDGSWAEWGRDRRTESLTVGPSSA